jgi:hypothetical protein
MVTPYTQVSIPDTVAWRSPPAQGLFDAHGNLLAITSYSLKGAQGINFAIPAEDFWR